MTQLIISEGTRLYVGAITPTATASDGKLVLSDYTNAAGATGNGGTTAPTNEATTASALFDGTYPQLNIVGFLQDLPTADPTRTESRVPTLDAGEIVGAGTTTRATMTFIALARTSDNADATAGYDAIKAAFKAKSTLTCLIVFTDNSRKWFQVHPTGAQESAPIGGNKQMSVGFVVQGEVVDVDAS